LHDGIEAPSRHAVDEQADQDALVEQAWARLRPGAGEEQEGEEIVMDAEAEGGEGDAEEEEGDEEGVDG